MIAAALSLGVIGYAQPTLIHPFDAGAAAGWSLGGAYEQTSELLVPEVRVKVSDNDAAVLNHAVFPAPSATASNALFGTTSGAQANRPRSIQLGGRLVF
jgi:hypothetical protein